MLIKKVNNKTDIPSRRVKSHRLKHDDTMMCSVTEKSKVWSRHRRTEGTWSRVEAFSRSQEQHKPRPSSQSKFIYGVVHAENGLAHGDIEEWAGIQALHKALTATLYFIFSSLLPPPPPLYRGALCWFDLKCSWSVRRVRLRRGKWMESPGNTKKSRTQGATLKLDCGRVVEALCVDVTFFCLFFYVVSGFNVKITSEISTEPPCRLW